MIEVCELTKQFMLPGGGRVDAVDAVSFRVAEGEIYGLLGPNGAGKTTTIRMILGLLSPTSGYAAIDGYRSADHSDEVKRRVGLVSASTGVYPWLTAREMLLFFADLYGVAVAVAKTELERLIDLLDMSRFIDQPCTTLSTGQRQRVSLARSLIHRPPVMLLDEPTNGLDVLGSQMVVEFVDHLRREGKAVIFCTHRLEEAERICTRFGLMHRGKIVSEGTLAQLRAATGLQSLVEMFLMLSDAGPLLSAGAAAAARTPA